MKRAFNPAQRLYSMMVALRNQSKKGTPIRKALGAAFDVDPANDSELLRTEFLLVGLIEEAERAIRRIAGIDHQKYLRYFPQIRKGLASAGLDQDSESFVVFRNAFADNVLQSVEFCALRLAEDVAEVELSEEEFKDLETRLQEVFDFTAEANLDPRVREVSWDVLGALRAALVDYRFRGLQGLEESIERSLGRLLLFYRRASPEDQKSNREQVSKLLDLVIKFEAVVAKACSYGPVLSEWGGRLLGA